MTESTDLATLLNEARRHGLRLDPLRSRLDDGGVDFRVLHSVDDTGVAWIVRFPRRPDVAERAAGERRALEFVRGRLPVAVPEWRIFSTGLIAYPRVAGEPAAVIDLDAGGYVWAFDPSDPPAVFLSSVGSTLASLHGLPAEQAESAGIPARDSIAIRESYADRIQRAAGVLAIPEVVRDRWIRWLDRGSCWPSEHVLVHGDLHPPHILVGSDGSVTGLLDWTEAHLGDRATDFAILFASLGGGALDRLLDAYRRAGGSTPLGFRDHVIETWAAYPLVIADFALETGEAGPLQLAQRLIEATAASMEADP